LCLSVTQRAIQFASFSSFPAFLWSSDDYYLLSNNLVVTETTNDIYNRELYKYITPNSLLSWIRTPLVNRLAKDGEAWVNLISRYVSGTYPNQWIVVDYNKFKPGNPLPDKTVLIAEEIPGHVEVTDVTPFVQQGYWPSYNIPFSEYIFNVSGYPTEVEEYGTSYTYAGNPRAEIFRRSAGSVETLQDMQHFIRYNDWKNDPLSLGDPTNQIAARQDLELQEADRDVFGAIDAKVTSYSLLRNSYSTWAQSGPSHDQQPPFAWSKCHMNTTFAHLGQPDLWDFDWILMSTDLSYAPLY